MPDEIRFVRRLNPLQKVEKFMAFRWTIPFTRSQRLNKVSWEAFPAFKSSGNPSRASVWNGWKLEEKSWHFLGMKRSKAQSFGKGQEIAECRVWKGRSSDRNGNTGLAGRSWEGLRIGTWTNGKVIEMQRAKWNAFLRHETIESSILREGARDHDMLSAEGKVFGPDRKREPHQAALGKSSDWNKVKRWGGRNASGVRHTTRGLKQLKGFSFGRSPEIADSWVWKGRSSDWTGSASPIRRFWENLRIGTGPNCEVFETWLRREKMFSDTFSQSKFHFGKESIEMRFPRATGEIAWTSRGQGMPRGITAAWEEKALKGKILKADPVRNKTGRDLKKWTAGRLRKPESGAYRVRQTRGE